MAEKTDRVDYAGAAEMTGLKEVTIRSYVTRGLMPKPEACPTCGDPVTWPRSIIEEWNAERPRRDMATG